MKFTPTQNYILVQKKEIKMSNIIVKPDTALDGFPYGEILAVGPAVEKYQKGDKVLFLVDNLIILDDTTKVGIIPAGAIFAYIDDENGND